MIKKIKGTGFALMMSLMMMAASGCAGKKESDSERAPIEQEKNISRMPLFAAASDRSNRFSPSDLDRIALIPTPVPELTAIIMLCSGNASVTAVSACSLI